MMLNDSEYKAKSTDLINISQ